tara:strand:- start:228 stop:956 length:729 start_codon:yes stop_codon:yes gene_type:complete
LKDKVIQKAKEIYNSLEFDELSHTYKINGEIYPSTSALIKQFYEPFKTDLIAGFVAKKYNKTKQQVLKEWQENNKKATDYGTKVHKCAEDYCLGIQSEDIPKSVIKFWDELPEYYELVFVELQMYSNEYKYAGTTDFVLLDTRDNTLVIGDYKTNKDLFKSYNNMLKPFEIFEDSSYNKYQIQLSYYQILLEQLGFKISNRMLVWLRGDDYEIYYPSDLTKILKIHEHEKSRYNTEGSEHVF